MQTNTLAVAERMAMALLTGALNLANPDPGPIAAYGNPSLMAAELKEILAGGGLSVPADELASLAVGPVAASPRPIFAGGSAHGP